MAEVGREPVVGVLGGSGVYDLAELSGGEWVRVGSTFGTPSDELLMGEVGGTRLVFLPRHGRGHRIPPSEINYRANIDVLKRAGVTDLISVAACGSLREDLSPGTFVLVDQFIDRTFARNKTFFTRGCVAHVSMAQPTCARLAERIEATAGDGSIVRGGTYLAMEGPQFSSRAESDLYRSWGCDVIGMTNMPEAKLAREAEICYASVAMVTDYDCWRDDHDAVAVSDIITILRRNAERSRSLVMELVRRFFDRPTPCPEGCDRALDSAIITPPSARDPETVRKLDAVAARVFAAS
jgi:5'-methylthioadenosine phosphorylase